MSTDNGENTAPLTNIRVLDFGHYIAGPLLGMLLADQGADVIKIESPSNAKNDYPIKSVLNRGKKRIVLDLKSQQGLEYAKDLIASADVLIENFRPGVMHSLGLGPKSMTQRNPRLIYVSLPGFRSSDRERSNIRAFEGVMSAASALFTDLHTPIRRWLDGPPIYTPLTPSSCYGAVHGAIATTLALYNREQTGSGDTIEIPLVAAAMSAMGAMTFKVGKHPKRYRPKPSWITRHIRIPFQKYRINRMTQEMQTLYWRDTINMRPPFADSLQASDGIWVQFWCDGNSRGSTQLIKALGIHESLMKQGFVDVLPGDTWGLDNNIKDPQAMSMQMRAVIREKIKEAFLKQTSDHWTKVMQEHGVPFSVHRTTREWLNAMEPREAALTIDVNDPKYGQMRQLGLQTSLRKTPESFLFPKAVQDLNGMAKEIWHPSKDKNKPELSTDTGNSKNLILEGVKVLDLSTVLAGPTCARTLAEYGASVIKIDSPEPYFLPNTHCWSGIEVSQGKRSIILDLKSKDGYDVFIDLVKTSDIVVHNMSPGTPERLGIDYDSLSGHKSDIIIMDLTAFEGPMPGPWGTLKGFDPVLQAATGIQSRYGGADNKPVLHGVASCIDYLTGYSGVFGTALALFRRTKNGQGDLVKTSLAQGGQLIQIPFMFTYPEQTDAAEAHGQETLGTSPLNHIYEASDGYVFLAGLPDEIQKLTSSIHFPELNTELSSTNDAIDSIGRSIKQHSTHFWVNEINDLGLGCHKIDTLEEIREKYTHQVGATPSNEDWNDGRTISIGRMNEHPVGSSVDNIAPAYAIFQNAEIKMGTPMPKLGYNTLDILTELGYSPEKIDSLLKNGSARKQFHNKYLPG